MAFIFITFPIFNRKNNIIKYLAPLLDKYIN